MAEKEYIEREKAFDAVFCQFCASSDETEAALNAAIEEIRVIPASDVRPVVLCKDCKHRFMTPNGWHCPYAEWDIEDDDFCSFGEKREE